MDETLVLCSHGNIAKFNDCRYCLIDKKQKQIEASFSNRINSLEEHKNCQIDENRKISRRVDEIEKEVIDELEDDANKHDERIANLETRINEIEERISTIENYMHKHDERINRMEQSREANSRTNREYQERICQLEIDVKQLEDLAKNFDENRIIIHKEPYKCPVCEGQPIPSLKREDGKPCIISAFCYPCDNKGIVWS